MSEVAPRRLILSLYGLYARPEGNWLSVAALVALMEDLGVDSAAVRSSVSRLKKRGVLEPVRREGAAGYALSDDAIALLRAGDDRIWSRPRATPADGWLVVVFSVPEAEREKRHVLRSLLTRLGFGTAAPGVWVAPGTSYDETLAALERQGLASYTEFFRGDYLGVGDVSARMAEWWDLSALSDLYDEFDDSYRPLLQLKRPSPRGRVHRLRADADLVAPDAVPRPGPAARTPAEGLGRRHRRDAVRDPRPAVVRPGRGACGARPTGNSQGI